MKEEIEIKKTEIEDYKKILKKNINSRWYDSGKRHLESLIEELNKLKGEQNGS